MEIAARWPDRVDGLALVASVGIESHRAIRRHRHLGILSTMLRMPGIRYPLTATIRRGFLRSGFRHGLTSDAVRQSIHLAATIDFDRHRENAPLVHAPTLVAWSSDDPLVEDRIGQQLADILPPGPRLRFEDGGHNIQKSRAGEIGQGLVRWVRAHQASRASDTGLPEQTRPTEEPWTGS